ncbi:MAG: hypothetical protein WKF78_04125 [Candidatus Limnocylindrales bacterium]
MVTTAGGRSRSARIIPPPTVPAAPSAPSAPTAPTAPSGVLFFVHGANETSEGVVENLARIEDQVRARGWDVQVVAPEWRRHSGLRLGNWRKAVYRRGRPGRVPIPSLRAGVGKAAILRMATDYYENRRESLLDALGAQLLADVIGYQLHRESIQGVLKKELRQAAAAARGRPVLPVGLSLGGIALVDLLGGLARRTGPGLRHRRLAGAAAVHLRRHPVAALRRVRPAAPTRPVAQRLRQPRLPVLPGRAAVPAFGRPRQRGRPARPLGQGLPAIA